MGDLYLGEAAASHWQRMWLLVNAAVKADGHD
jgi:hypothetical protein